MPDALMAGVDHAAFPLQPCPRCGAPMLDIKGSRQAICGRCGYKDDCC